jgi:uncharacterized protein
MEKRTLPYRINKADSFGKRLRGLMFRKDPLMEEGLWITPCNSIHMCFMNFAIDAIFVSKEGRIVELIEELRPWRFVKPVQKAHSVVELPSGAIRELNLLKGEYVNL